MRTLTLDIMKDGGRRFYKTLQYRFIPPISMEAMILWIVWKLPSLKNRDFVFYADAHDGRQALRMEVKCNKLS